MISNVWFEPISDVPLSVEKLAGLTRGGIMSMTYREYPASGCSPTAGPSSVYARGLVSTRDGSSCIIEATLRNGTFESVRQIIHPVDVPVSQALGLPVFGYEDQTVVPSRLNFIEPDTRGLLIVEACHAKSAPTGYSTCLIYLNPATGFTKTVLTPLQARERGLTQYEEIEMVKEAAVFEDSPGTVCVHLEVRADGRSRIVKGAIRNGEIDNLVTLLEPGSVQWAGNSYSTAFAPVRLDEDTRLLVVNGRAANDVWSTGACLLDNDGTVIRVEAQPWLTADPADVELHENGQRIVYCSDGYLDGDLLTLVYHQSDDRIRVARGKVGHE